MLLTIDRRQVGIDWVASETVLLEFVAERSDADPQLGCRLGAVAAGLPESGTNRMFLQLIQA
jgi:hypothetical protein